MARIDADYISQILAESFGSESIRVCTPHHVQVRHGGQVHQVYVNTRGSITLHRQGQKRARHMRNPEQVIESIASHRPEKTDIAKMQEAVDLAKFVGYARKALPTGEKVGVFVDAGWKDGIAVIALVEIRRGELGLSTVAQSWPERTGTIQDAERRAIQEALAFNTIATVFSDCKSVVDSLNNQRVKWIPREQNKVADHIGNRRNA